MPLSPRFRPALLALLLTTAPTLAPQGAAAQGTAGAFLAAREAGVLNDFTASLPYLQRLHAADPENAGTLESLVVSAFSVGAFDLASQSAAQLVAIDPDNRAAALVLLAQAFQQGDYDAALAVGEGDAPVHPLIDGLARAWAQLGAGRMSDALATLDEVAGGEGMRAFAQYCRALALALVGDVEGAVSVIEDPQAGVSAALNRRGYVAYAQLLGLSERYEDAETLIDTVFPTGNDPAIARMRTALAAREAVPFDVVTSPAQGMAEVFSVMANAMMSAQNPVEALIYAQAAVWVNPSLTDSQLLIGQIFEDLDQPQAAAAAYEAIPDSDVFGTAARMGRAQVLETLERRDEAIADLTALADENPQSYAVQSVLGDFLRRASRFPEAAAAYTRALGLLQAAGVQPEWQLWFSRAVALARADDWDAAESDFRAALALQPDQPTVLNYLGYSLVERGEKLDEAMDMIQRAVAGDPDSGYVLDSLAWALYRLGRYTEAVPHMERAVQMAPTDAILNDHLGDVYWAVGRQREARFQWRRALSFAPADDLDEDRLRRKLEIGLDAVRAEAGEPPLHPAN
ncbi:MAG: tetratricopeptide repeat protein [Rhodobacteraceae bacterium]|nr:tetratricopeptide repeat protein [Paracoccaceae bacterium]